MSRTYCTKSTICTICTICVGTLSGVGWLAPVLLLGFKPSAIVLEVGLRFLNALSRLLTAWVASGITESTCKACGCVCCGNNVTVVEDGVDKVDALDGPRALVLDACASCVFDGGGAICNGSRGAGSSSKSGESLPNGLGRARAVPSTRAVLSASGVSPYTATALPVCASDCTCAGPSG